MLRGVRVMVGERLVEGGGEIPVPFEVFEKLVELEDEAAVNMFDRHAVARRAREQGMIPAMLLLTNPYIGQSYPLEGVMDSSLSRR